MLFAFAYSAALVVRVPDEPSAPSGSNTYAQNITVVALSAIGVIIAVWSWWVFRPRDRR